MNQIIKGIQLELKKMGLSGAEKFALEGIRNKAGIHLYRIRRGGDSFVLKYFLGEDDTREIRNYTILNRLGVPTIKVIARTGRSLLLEDISGSDVYRLGTAGDLSDTVVARLIAEWYRNLHAAGERYLATAESGLYRETDLITRENIVTIRDKSGTSGNPVWPLLINNFQAFKGAIAGLKSTLTFNDFFWTNLVVRKDKIAALMFDYNLLGAGYRYGDLRNVCSALSESGKAAFLERYGNYDMTEKLADDCICVLVDLITAFTQPSFPSWAAGSLEQVTGGGLYKAVKKLEGI